MRLTHWVITISVSAFLGACGGKDELTVVYESQHCAKLDEGIVLVENEAALERLSRNQFSLSEVKEKYPNLNYEDLNVIAVSLGRKPNGGYSLTLTDKKTKNKQGVLSLPIEQIKPQADQMYTQAVVQPCLVVATKKQDYGVIEAAGMRLELTK